MDRADNEQADHRMNTIFHTVTSAKNKIRKSRVRGWSGELYHEDIQPVQLLQGGRMSKCGAQGGGSLQASKACAAGAQGIRQLVEVYGVRKGTGTVSHEPLVSRGEGCRLDS